MTTCKSSSFAPVSADFDGLLALIHGAFEGIALWERDPWRVGYANPAFWQVVGARAEVPGTEPGSTDVAAGLKGRMTDLLDQFSDLSVEKSTATFWPNLQAGGKPIEIRLCRVAGGDRQTVGMMVRAYASEPPLTRDTNASVRRDPLTALPDREFLMKRLSTLLTGERLSDRQFAVVFLDLDDFKQVNEEFGHLIGDAALREAAKRIASCLRERDQVVRYGGDEFVVIVEGVTAAHEVDPVVERIHMAFAKPIALPAGEVLLSLSAGVALTSEAGGSPEELLAAADRAMYVAKRTSVERQVHDG